MKLDDVVGAATRSELLSWMLSLDLPSVKEVTGKVLSAVPEMFMKSGWSPGRWRISSCGRCRKRSQREVRLGFWVGFLTKVI